MRTIHPMGKLKEYNTVESMYSAIENNTIIIVDNKKEIVTVKSYDASLNHKLSKNYVKYKNIYPCMSKERNKETREMTYTMPKSFLRIMKPRYKVEQ